MKQVTKKVVTKKKEKPVVYQAANGAVELRVDFKYETLWARQNEVVWKTVPNHVGSHLSLLV